MIPLVDLKKQYIDYKIEIDQAIMEVISEGQFIGGDQIKTFESSFGKFLGEGELISCANGTDSMEMILKSWGIGEGNEVLVPALTWISTSEAVVTNGATPVFVDIDVNSKCIDPEKIESKITARTKAIIVVHLYGQSADLSPIIDLAKKYELKILEDCAQAHGTKYKDQFVGNYGDAASFSFYPGKSLGCYGDGGAVYTKDPILSKSIRMIKNHGQLKKHENLINGRNSRMDNLQAAILNVKLKYLPDWIIRKQQISQLYIDGITNNSIKIPIPSPNCDHSWHIFAINHDRRDALKSFLADKGIQTAIHYPSVLPHQACYQISTNFPQAEKQAATCLSLPMYAELSESQIEFVIKSINEFE